MLIVPPSLSSLIVACRQIANLHAVLGKRVRLSSLMRKMLVQHSVVDLVTHYFLTCLQTITGARMGA